MSGWRLTGTQTSNEPAIRDGLKEGAKRRETRLKPTSSRTDCCVSRLTLWTTKASDEHWSAASPPDQGLARLTEVLLRQRPVAQVTEELFHFARQRFRRGCKIVGGGEH